jgi:GxxExxY protein
MTDNEITFIIIGAALEVHKNLGPGLSEKTYEYCLEYELKQKKLKVMRQDVVPINYKGAQLNTFCKLDLIVENRVIVELKAIQELSDLHKAQLRTYLKLKKLNTGLLINFNTVKLISGIKRLNI